MALPYHVISAPWNEHQQALRDIRRVVFIVEQNVSQEEEWDGLDEDSEHFLAINEIGQHIGCARLLPSGQIGRMAVLQEHRGTGVGAALLDAAVQQAKNKGAEHVFLHAQTHATDFYRKAGFVASGSEFMDAGIPHVNMELKLPLTFAGSATQHVIANSSQKPSDERMIPSEPTLFEDLAHAQQHLTTLLSQARRRIAIFHPNLDQELFDHGGLIDAVSHLARSAPLAEVQILVMDTKLIVDRGHKLHELSRRLDDKIKLRRMDEAVSAQTSAYACIDSAGYWLLPNWQSYHGVVDAGNVVTCQRLLETFRRSWSKSREASELRTLKL